MPIANDSGTPAPRLRPTGARHWILLFAATLAIITYIDRVCISQAAGDIQRDLGLTKVQMGWAFAAFAWAYALSGTLTAVSAIIIAFYTNSVSPASHGNFYELYAIAAAVIGGCSLRGGEGTVLGIVIGAALLQVLRNLVNLLDIPGSLDFAVMGAVILFGAVADQLFGRRMRRGGA